MLETESSEQNNSKEIWAAANRVAALFYILGNCVATRVSAKVSIK